MNIDKKLAHFVLQTGLLATFSHARVIVIGLRNVCMRLCQRRRVVGAERIIPICGGSMSEMSGDFEYAYDLMLDEARRRTAVLEAIGDDWDPVQVLAEEERAWGMLYRGLDDDQQRIYDELVSAGVLPDRAVNRVSD